MWQDAKSNGVVDAGEMKSLMALGITGISLTSDGVAYSAASGDVSVVGTGSVTYANGTTGVLADAAFLTGAKSADEELRAALTPISNAALLGAVAAAGLAAMPAHAELRPVRGSEFDTWEAHHIALAAQPLGFATAEPKFTRFPARSKCPSMR